VNCQSTPLLLSVPLSMPCSQFTIQPLDITITASSQTLSCQCRYLYFGNVQPSSGLEGTMLFHLLCKPERFLRRKSLIQRRDSMSIQIVHDQNPSFCIRILGIEQPLYLMRPVLCGIASTCRQPPSGSVHMKMLLVPLCRYSVCPGFAGSGPRTSSTNRYGFPSIPTTGYCSS
jgi:hypothetical protein